MSDHDELALGEARGRRHVVESAFRGEGEAIPTDSCHVFADWL